MAQRAQADAEAALQTREHFIATASHELKTPLTSLMGYASLLSTAAARSPADAAHMADKVLHQSERLHTLIEQLLDVTHLEQGQFLSSAGP